MTYMPWPSTIWPRDGRAVVDGPTLTMRCPSTTIVERRCSAPVATSTTVALVIVSVCAERSDVVQSKSARRFLRNDICSEGFHPDRRSRAAAEVLRCAQDDRG